MALRRANRDESDPLDAQWIDPRETVAGCRVLGPLGSGATGTVHRAIEPGLEREVALKTLAPAIADDPEFVERLQAEGRLLASLDHPNIARVYALAREGLRCYLILELVDGESLGERIRRLGRLAPAEAARIALQVCRALDFADMRGVAHRDIKPGNIMVTPAGIAKVVDFGIARDVRASAGSGPRESSGTAPFMSPEQGRGDATDCRSDIYSLGITLWYALTGRLPFDGPTPLAIAVQQMSTPVPDLPPDVPPLLRALIDAMTRRTADERPRSFGEVADVLRRVIDSVPVEPWGLVVQPDAACAERFAVHLREHDVVPVVVETGEDALAAMDVRGTPAVIVTELSVPRIDGLALVRAARRRSPPPAAIAFSAYPELRASARAQADALGLAAVASVEADSVFVHAILGRALRGGGAATLPEVRRADPVRDAVRAGRLEAMGVVDDGPPPERLQAIVSRVADALQVPASLVSLVMPERQWFKAHHGLTGRLLAERGTPIEDAFCRHVVRTGRPLVVNDAADNPLFARNRLVEAGAVGSYAGAPITTADGHALGTLCAITPDPHAFGRDAVAALTVLARRVAGELALESAAEAVAERELPRWIRADGRTVDERLFDRGPDPALLLEDGVIHRANAEAAAISGFAPDMLSGLTRDDYLQALESRFGWPATIRRALRVPLDGPYAGRERHDLDAFSSLRWSARPVSLGEDWIQLEIFMLSDQSAAHDWIVPSGVDGPEWSF